jgi:glucose dehydrogenase
MIFPSIEGAHNWQAMSYSPVTGLAYIPALNAPSSYYVVGGKPDGDGWADIYVPGPNERPQPSGELIAWDPVKQQARWSINLKFPYNGGTLVTAGNLVFQGTAEGDFTARKADTGKLLWSMPVVSATQAPPVTFRDGDKQYVVLPVGASGAVRMYLPEYGAPPSAQGPTRLLAFTLNAKGTVPGGVLTKPPLPKPLPQFASAAEIAKGSALYQEAECMTCHGARLDVAAGGSAPDLRYLPPEVHKIWNSVVIDGALKSAGMPAFKDVLSPSDAEAIRAYVLDQAQKLYDAKSANVRSNSPPLSK